MDTRVYPAICIIKPRGFRRILFDTYFVGLFMRNQTYATVKRKKKIASISTIIYPTWAYLVDGNYIPPRFEVIHVYYGAMAVCISPR